MAQLARNALKALFISGYKPTQADYASVFDSFLNFITDRVPSPNFWRGLV